jgi:hypothetical protein
MLKEDFSHLFSVKYHFDKFCTTWLTPYSGGMIKKQPDIDVHCLGPTSHFILKMGTARVLESQQSFLLWCHYPRLDMK